MAKSSRARRFDAGRPSMRWLVAMLLWSSPAASASEDSARTVVVMVPEPEPPLPLQRLIEALRSQLVELGIGVQVSTGPAGPSATDGPPTVGRERNVLAFVWIEHTGDALVVHFYEPAGASLRERHIPVTGTDAASLEEVAVVVRSAATALLERAGAAAVEPPPPPPVSPPRAIPAASRRQSLASAPPPLQAALAYTGTLHGSDTAWQHGAMGSVSLRLATTPWRLGVGYAWLMPVRYATNDLEISIYRHPVELSLGYEFPAFGPHFTLRAEGATIADYVVRKTSRATGDLEGLPSTARWSWAVSTRLRLGWEAMSRSWLFVSGGADFVLNRFEYVVENAEENPVLTPLAVRPHLQVGAALDWP